jgi:uncharacterized protein (DUF2252 family)
MGTANTTKRRGPVRSRAQRQPAQSEIEQTSANERATRGKGTRSEVPRSSHAAWEPPSNRASPVDLLERQAKSRIPELVPIRHGRMLISPFSYYRGAALPMTSDLATTPNSGLRAQICGDAHLCNFGVFGSPERHLFFDVNDFDETAPGPWEWDVKRLAASLEVAARDNGFPKQARKNIVRRAVRSYRETMREFAQMSVLEVWYAHLDMDELLPRFHSRLDRTQTPAVWKAIAKARAHDSEQAFAKLAEVVDGECRILHQPPLITPIEELGEAVDAEAVLEAMEAFLRSYRDTLRPDRRRLLKQYRLVHVARKVVGVGSVGTQAWILLLLDDQDVPLFLQMKEADTSVIEEFTSRSEFSHCGHRVVVGQRLMQAASDIFLGWERSAWLGDEREYYIRQLRDWKGSADIEGMTTAGMELWGRMCGWTLARAHARSGDRAAIAAYLGKSDVFDRAIGKFSVAYADQNERDYQAFKEAVASGRLAAETDA